MAFAAANLRLFYSAVCFAAISAHLHTALKRGAKWTNNAGMQLEKFTGVCAHNPGNWTGLAQIRCPSLAGSFEKATFFQRASAEIVTIKVFTFDARGSTHFGLGLASR